MIHTGKLVYMCLCILLCSGCINESSEKMEGVSGCSCLFQDGENNYLVIETYGAERLNKSQIDRELSKILGDYSEDGNAPEVTEKRYEPEEKTSKSGLEIMSIPALTEEQKKEDEQLLESHVFIVEYIKDGKEQTGKMIFSYLKDEATVLSVIDSSPHSF